MEGTVYLGSQFQRVSVPHGRAEVMVASSNHGDRNRKPRVLIFKGEHKTECEQ